MKDRILAAAREIRPRIEALSDAIYANPELGNQEVESSRLHAELLKSFGFQVEKPYMGLTTGYRAEYRSRKSGPRICYMAEYDALPGIGHGCGHNMLGSTSLAAGVILSKLTDDIGGSVVVLGTPAEETNGAKVEYAKRGAFLDIDAAMMAHPTSQDYCKSGSSLAMETLEFEFFGKTAHAASEPEMGINALDAVILTFNNINALRQQTKPDARIHGIITKGGEACNVIPDHCVCRFYVRAASRIYLKHLLEQVLNCGKAAAVATGCRVTARPFELGYEDLATNQTLSALFTESLQEFGVTNIREAGEDYGSVDAGNVSHVCPTIHPYFPITKQNIAGHTREFAACTKTDYAKDRMMETAAALALTGAKLITDPAAMAEVKREFKRMK